MLDKGKIEINGNAVIYVYPNESITNQETIISPYLGIKYGMFEYVTIGFKYSPYVFGDSLERQILSPYILYGYKWDNHSVCLSNEIYFFIDTFDKKFRIDNAIVGSSICYRYDFNSWAPYAGAALSQTFFDLYCGAEYKFKLMRLYCTIGTSAFIFTGNIHYLNINPGISIIF